jgi:hypothetical protein
LRGDVNAMHASAARVARLTGKNRGAFLGANLGAKSKKIVASDVPFAHFQPAFDEFPTHCSPIRPFQFIRRVNVMKRNNGGDACRNVNRCKP